MQKECEGAYRKGIELIRQEKDIISSYDARRLSLYLNLSVYYYEIMSATTKATEVC